MKKYFYLLLSILLITFSYNVYACGEISDVTTSIGTITKKNNTNYIITIPKGTDKLTIGAKTEYDFISGYGPREVSTSNKAQIKVDGAKCGYGIYTYFFTFVVEQKQDNVPVPTPNPDGNNGGQIEEPPVIIKPYLKDLKIENIEINFNKEIFEYSIEVEEDVVSLVILPETEDDNVKVTIDGNYQNLTYGLNTIQINLKDSSNNTTAYTLNVSRKKTLSANNYLANIKVENYVLNFDPSVSKYDLKIGKEKVLNIVVNTQNDRATYEIIGNNSLENGSNITIKVTAEDGSQRIYTINIFKETKDLSIYLIYGGIALVIIIILLVVLVIIRNNKKKKQTNNDINETPVNYINSNNYVQSKEMFENPFVQQHDVPQNNIQSNQIPQGPVTLEFVNPSYFDNVHVDENTSNTEIFKL